MKCSYCGAPKTTAVCEYCGTVEAVQEEQGNVQAEQAVMQVPILPAEAPKAENVPLGFQLIFAFIIFSVVVQFFGMLFGY